METAFFIGRIIFGAYFIFNGANHFMQFGMMTAYAKSKGVPIPPLAVALTGLMLLVGGLCIVVGIYPVLGTALLVVFLVPVSFVMHRFWSVEDPQLRMVEMVNFTKNLALAGAVLMMLAIPTPWPLELL